MELFFCEKCGKRMSNVELERGEGKLVGGLAWCDTCKESAPGAPPTLPPKARPPAARAGGPRPAGRRASPVPAPPGARRPEGAPRPARQRAAPPAEGGLPIPAIAIAGGLGIGLLVGLLVFWSAREPETAPPASGPRPEAPARRRTGPTPATVSDVASRPAAPASPAPRPAAPTSTADTRAPPPQPAAPPAARDRLLVTISSPRPGSLFKPGSDVTVNAMAMGGDGQIARIEFLRDGEKIGEAEGGSRSFTWRSVPEGTYGLTARAFDGSGESAESRAVQVNVAPTRAAPGYFVEAESGSGNMQTKPTEQASGGNVVQGNSTGRHVQVDIPVAGGVTGACVAIRTVGWGSQNGSLRVDFGPAGGGLQEVGGRIDCRGGWKWMRIGLGRDVAPGTYRVKLRVPNERGGGAFDVIGIVPGGASLPNRLPNTLVEGRLEENGWTVEVGRSVSVAGAAAGGGAPGGGATAAPARPRVSDERTTFAALARRYDRGKVIPKKLAAIGGSVAGGSSFDALLKRELTRGNGYAFAGKMGLAGSGRTAASIRKGLEGRGMARRQLDYEKPEVVRICFDVKEATRIRDAAQLEADITFIAEEVLDRGGVPVLFTLFAGPQRVAEAEQRIRSYNDAVVRVASSVRVPFVDAWGILNSDRSKLGAYFTAAGHPKPAACDEVNAKLLDLYRKLEANVLARE